MGEEQTKPIASEKKSNSILWLIIIIVIIFFCFIGGGIYYYFKIYKKPVVTESLKIPDSCPKNMPIYPKARILTITCKPDASSIESLINADLKKIKEWYKTELEKNGWKIRNEDSTSYLFDNDQEIGKVSLSIEKKNTVIKFLIAKRTSGAPSVKNSSRSSTETSPEQYDSSGLNGGIFDSMVDWEDYFDSTEADYSSPTDEGIDWQDSESEEINDYSDESLNIEEEAEEEAVPEEEIIDEETSEEETVEPEPTDETEEPNCWIDEEDGGLYCDNPM